MNSERLATWALVTVAAAYILVSVGHATLGESKPGSFERVVVDPSGPSVAWGKTAGDINGDGLTDLIVGGRRPPRQSFYARVLRKLGIRRGGDAQGELVWYQNPTWERHLVSTDYKVRTDLEVGDVDGDGKNDLIVLTDAGLLWLRNPDWSPTTISAERLHDVEVSDLDGDGDLDVIARNQTYAEYNAGNAVHLYRQDTPFRWRHSSISVPHGEGLRVADLNADTRPDVVVNSVWLENPDLLEKGRWSSHRYGDSWEWRDVTVDVADIDGDGRKDIVLAPSEQAGQRYRISWFRAPDDGAVDWTEHVIDPDVEAVHHFVAAADVDNDGDIDVMSAEMNQGVDPDEVKVYINERAVGPWQKHVIDSAGSHSMRAIDIDNDFDVDVFGAPWDKDGDAPEYPVHLWVNHAEAGRSWQRHVIDDARPWTSLFVFAADMDQDGYKDIVTGGWWYRNPGTPGQRWRRTTIGGGAHNVVAVHDFDGDGYLDVVASQWDGGRQPGLLERVRHRLGVGPDPYGSTGHSLVWARNDTHGRFQVHRNIERSEGDYPQGAIVASVGGRMIVVLSWHKPGYGIQTLTVPSDPVGERWPWRRISATSQDEAVSVGDIDGDGDHDIMLGTIWLRNEGQDRWQPFELHPTERLPDRHQLVDMNRDGRLDVVVGYEAVNEAGIVAWYEQGAEPTRPWQEHIIATVTGPMSLDVEDLDHDNDLDVIVGEHNYAYPDTARLMVFENRRGDSLSWKGRVVHMGDEHHNGSQVVDIDNDGDLDVISIGWAHDRVIVYENRNDQ